MDCSVTKRKGCNYCLRGKDFGQYKFEVRISDEDKAMTVRFDDSEVSAHDAESIDINYCPICGKEL